MSPLDAVRRELADVGYTLSRAMPRSADHLLLQVVPDAGGAELAGQWFRHRDRARKVATATATAAATAGAGPVHRFGNVVLQGGGADRRLPGLAALAREPGARLVAHRAERRGVVGHQRHGETVFTKVVRPGRATALADGLREVAAVLTVPVPEVVAVDAGRGSVTTRALPGRMLHDRLGDAVGGHLPGPEMTEVGQVVAALHRATPPAGTASHGAAEEVAVVHRWLDHAARFGVTPRAAPVLHRETARMEALLGRPPAPAALLHRDLHDKQLLLGPDGPGILDLDLLAVGDPALDLANLVVHLELRARQGVLPEDAAVDLARAFVSAYRPADAVRSTAPGYLLATRLRLAAVYAFRPASTAAAARLLTEPLMTELP